MRKIVKSFLVIGCIVTSTAFGSLAAFADDAAPATGHEHFQGQFQRRGAEQRRRFFKVMAKELKLTADQKSQAKALFKSNRESMKPLLANVMGAKHQLNTLAASGNADQGAIQAQSGALASAEANLAVQKAQNERKFLALLTPDQVTTYHAIQAKREARFQKFLSRLNAAPAAQ